MKKFDCLGIGITPLDILLTVDKFPARGEKINALNKVISGGGPVPTALATLSKLGLKTAIVGKYGDDLTGNLLYQEFQQVNIAIDYLSKIKHAITTTATIIIEKQGRRTVLLSKGKGCKITPRDISEKIIKQTKALHLDGRDLPACKKALKLARKNNVVTFLDIGSERRDADILFPDIDHLIVAEEFVRYYTNRLSMIKALLDLFIPTMKSVVITLGEKGAIGYNGSEIFKVPAYDINVVDATGAGDAFHGGYIYAVLNDFPLEKRLLFASASAALNCRKIGGRAGLPTLGSVRKLIKTEKFR